MAIFKNLIIEQGTNFSHTFNIVDPISSIPRDFTGWTLLSKFKKSYGSSNSTPFNVVFINITLGEIKLSVPSYTTDFLKQGKYVYDIEATAPNGDIERIVEGQITLSPQVTTLTSANSTIPGTGNLDLGTLASGTFDAFGVPIINQIPVIDLMIPTGQIVTSNLGQLQ